MSLYSAYLIHEYYNLIDWILKVANNFISACLFNICLLDTKTHKTRSTNYNEDILTTTKGNVRPIGHIRPYNFDVDAPLSNLVVDPRW